MKSLKDHSQKLEYIALCMLERLLTIVPRRVSLAIGAFAGSVLYRIGIRKKIALLNMNHVGYWTPQEQEVILKKLYRNIGRYGAEFLRAPLPPPPYEIHNFETITRLHNRGKGVIALVAHFGNWELLARIFGKALGDLNVMAKPMRNKAVNEWLAQKRELASVTTIYTSNALRKIYEVIKRNGVMAVLIDQYVGNQGTLVPFLGKRANTARTVAGIQYKTGCSIMPTYAIMKEDGRYEVMIQEAPACQPTQPSLF